MPRQYPPEFRQRALRLLDEAMPDYESEFEAIRQVASKLGNERGGAAQVEAGWSRLRPEIGRG